MVGGGGFLGGGGGFFISLPVSALATKLVVGLYFSAHWCAACRAFSLKLAEAYSKLSSQGSFEVVWVSSDKDPAAFAAYFQACVCERECVYVCMCVCVYVCVCVVCLCVCVCACVRAVSYTHLTLPTKA